MIEWRTIPGSDGRYEACSDGRVRNARDGHILSSKPNPKGYHYVHLWLDGKRRCPRLHRIIAAVFVPNPDGKPHVNHRDLNKSNNAASNLEWITERENYLHGHANGRTHCITNPNKVKRLTVEQVAEARRRRKAGESVSALARELGVHSAYMSLVCRGLRRPLG